MLYVIATPIGDPEDISLRAQRLLNEADVIIGEEAKPTRRLLKSVGIPPQKEIQLLNEHSKPEDINILVEICKSKNVALVTDCGTPGFCDPGAHLVNACREIKIPVQSIPGPSSLMSLLSVSGHRLDQFYFQGFLPAKTEIRRKSLNSLKKRSEAIVLMDTPYRLKKTLADLKEFFPKHQIVLGMNLSTDQETLLEGTAAAIEKHLKVEKAEFVLIIRSRD